MRPLCSIKRTAAWRWYWRGVSPGDPVSLILARPDVHRVIVRAVLRAVQTINSVHHLPAQHLLVAHEIRRAVPGPRSVRWLRLRDPIHHRSLHTAKLPVVGRSWTDIAAGHLVIGQHLLSSLY